MLDQRADALSRDTCRVCLLLLDAVVLALKDRDRWEQLDQADEALLRLRQRIRLAQDRDIFDERQALHALGLCDRIGRQIGGCVPAPANRPSASGVLQVPRGHCPPSRPAHSSRPRRPSGRAPLPIL